MGDRLKKFFKKTKTDLKFQRAGPGHRLNETSKNENVPKPHTPPVRVEPTSEAKQAAAAALARLENKAGTSVTTGFKNSLLRSEVMKELKMEAEQKQDRKADLVKDTKKENQKNTAVSGVFFKCPLIGPEVLTEDEWKAKISEHLYEQLKDEKAFAASLIIRNCNSDKEKVASCVETLTKYLKNIMDHPDEEKYRKIKASNKVFQERIASLEGTKEFLEAAGFVSQTTDVDGKQEEFWIFNPSSIDADDLEALMDALASSEVIGLELDRNLQILSPSKAIQQCEIPDDFFKISLEEFKREMKRRNEELENAQILKTKAMREKEEQRELRNCLYAVIRIRFPDSLLLQGTFRVQETLEDVYKFANETLSRDFNYELRCPTFGESSLPDVTKTLLELKLPPASVLSFHCKDDFSGDTGAYFKPELAALIQHV